MRNMDSDPAHLRSIRNIGIEARYTHGLRNINADDEDDQEVKNRVFSILFGIKIGRR